MGKRVAAALTCMALLALAGCSAGGGRASEAMDMCVTAAEDEVGVTLNRDGLASANTDDALFEAGVTDTRDTDDANALFTVTGDVTWVEDGTETRKSMLCMVQFTDGEPELSLPPTLS